MIQKPRKTKSASGDGTTTLSKSAAVVGARYKVPSNGKRLRLDKIVKPSEGGPDRLIFRHLNPGEGDKRTYWLDINKFQEWMQNGTLELDVVNASDYRPPKNPQAFGNTSGLGLEKE